MSGPVPASLPQSSQAAEHAVRIAAVECLVGPSILYGDCKAVVETAQLPLKSALKHHRVYAGVSRRSFGYDGNKFVLCDRKVPAHQDPGSAGNEADKWKAVGNNVADSAVVAAKGLHLEEARAHKLQRKHDRDEWEDVARVIAEVGALWPEASGQATKLEQPHGVERRRRRKERGREHQWVHWSGRWGCKACLALADTAATKTKRIEKETCPGKSQTLCEILGVGGAGKHDELQHKFVALHTSDCELGLLCLRCGGWATTRPQFLMQTCKAPTDAGANALRRARKGLHPWTERGVIIGRFPLCGGVRVDDVATGSEQNLPQGNLNDAEANQEQESDNAVVPASSRQSVPQNPRGETEASFDDQANSAGQRLARLRERVCAREGRRQ